MTVLGKRRLQYEEELSHEARNYDVWFDYARLEEDACRGENGSADAVKRVREVYERAVAQVPPSEEKRHWRRYIFLWLNYALFEELDTKVLFRVPVPRSKSLRGRKELTRVSPLRPRSGPATRARDLPRVSQARPAQKVHVRQGLGPVCRVRGAAAGARRGEEGPWNGDRAVPEGKGASRCS